MSEKKTWWRGQVIDRLADDGGRLMYESRACATWEQAQDRAERACRRMYGRGADRYAVQVVAS